VATFPAHQGIQQYNETPQEAVRRTPFESGYQQQAKRFYNQWINADVEVRFSAAEYEAFLTWVRDDIANGSASFTFPNHKQAVGGSPEETINARMIGGQFQAAPIRQYAHNYWLVTFTLEYKAS